MNCSLRRTLLRSVILLSIKEHKIHNEPQRAQRSELRGPSCPLCSKKKMIGDT
jgi:hypothetical protein